MNNKKVTSYKLLIASDLSNFSELVNQEINAGWQPLGGIAARDGLYVQSMALYGQDDN